MLKKNINEYAVKYIKKVTFYYFKIKYFQVLVHVLIFELIG